MWLAIVGLLKSFFGVAQQVAQYLQEQMLLEAGAAQATAQADTRALKDIEKANEIEASPDLPPAQLFNELRSPTAAASNNGLRMGSPDLLQPRSGGVDHLSS